MRKTKGDPAGATNTRRVFKGCDDPSNNTVILSFFPFLVNDL